MKGISEVDDHGDTPATATPLALEQTVAGFLNLGEADVFAVDLEAGGTYVFEAIPTGPELDVIAATIIAPDGTTEVAENAWTSDDLRLNGAPGLFFNVTVEESGDAGVDQFRDFEDGVDRIDVALTGATGLAEFTAAQTAPAPGSPMTPRAAPYWWPRLRLGIWIREI